MHEGGYTGATVQYGRVGRYVSARVGRAAAAQSRRASRTRVVVAFRVCRTRAIWILSTDNNRRQ